MNIFGIIWDFFISLFGYVMEFCYSISFGNYAIALLIYAIFFKLLLLPFSIKQQKTTVKNAVLRPRIAAIEKKYEGKKDRESIAKKQQEIMELQQRNGASPLKGCLPLLIQMPIIIALFEIIRRPLTFISHIGRVEMYTIAGKLGFTTEAMFDSYFEVTLLSQLQSTTNPEVLEYLSNTGATLPQLQMGIVNFGEVPSFANPTLTLAIPFLVFASQFASMLLMQYWSGTLKNTAKENRITSWIMMLLMPLLTFSFALRFSAAIGMYWIYQSLLGLLQSFLLSRLMPIPEYTDEEIREIEQKEKEKMRAEVKTSKRGYSLHHIDDDDEIDESLVPVIQSKYDDDGDISPDTPATRANPNSKTQQKKTNKSKKKNKH